MKKQLEAAYNTRIHMHWQQDLGSLKCQVPVAKKHCENKALLEKIRIVQQAVEFIQLIVFASCGVDFHDSVRGVERAKLVFVVLCSVPYKNNAQTNRGLLCLALCLSYIYPRQTATQRNILQQIPPQTHGHTLQHTATRSTAPQNSAASSCCFGTLEIIMQ